MKKINNLEIFDSTIYGKGLGFDYKKMSFYIDEMDIDISEKKHSDTIDLPNGGKYTYTESTYNVDINSDDFLYKKTQIMDLSGINDIDYNLSDQEIKEIISEIKEQILDNIENYTEHEV
jgi:hypothetical protein